MRSKQATVVALFLCVGKRCGAWLTGQLTSDRHGGETRLSVCPCMYVCACSAAAQHLWAGAWWGIDPRQLHPVPHARSVARLFSSSTTQLPNLPSYINALSIYLREFSCVDTHVLPSLNSTDNLNHDQECTIRLHLAWHSPLLILVNYSRTQWLWMRPPTKSL